MNKRWPHFLKAFWVLSYVVRKGSFSAAAVKLNISQSAVSQHIRQLEDQFGPLFDRVGKQIQPNDRCKLLVPHLSKAFSQIDEGVAALMSEYEQQITLSVLPSFASGWLVPRLANFAAEQPEVEVRIAMSDTLTDFSDSSLDAGIRLGHGNYPDLIVKPLCPEEMFLVCSPMVRSTLPEHPEFSDLANVWLFHDSMHGEDNWGSWVKETGYKRIRVKNSVVISHADQVIRMALVGKGVALARKLLVADYLDNGELVRIFDTKYVLDSDYYFVMPMRSRGNKKLEQFYEWLRRELANSLNKKS